MFYKNALPNDAPQMAVGLLLDESGSMSSGDRTAYARAAAIILYDFCQALRIPVMVYGHSTRGSKVELYSYGEFDAIDQNDKYPAGGHLRQGEQPGRRRPALCGGAACPGARRNCGS